MNFKIIFIAVFLIAAVTNVAAQKNIVTLMINGKKIGERTIVDSPAIINVNKMKYKNISDISVIIKQVSVSNIFKRSLQITDDDETQLLSVNETRSKHGVYKIPIAGIRQKIMDQKIIKIFLAEDPANPMMMVRSSRKLLAELHLK
ncbi:MAG: hypothetical protein M3004_03630 [Bacteroidota bacterium]|nr:hypothetical protein [Bacteroidota bacterium]